MAAINEASSRVCTRFYEYEGTIPAMDSFPPYVTRYGILLAFYADKPLASLPTVDDQLAGVMPTSQLGRVLADLGVELIPAHLPQAKSRVEGLFKTFQDWLIKELLARRGYVPGNRQLLRRELYADV